MERLNLETFASRADDFDRAALSTQGVDQFCSSVSWILPANQAFHLTSEAAIYETDHGFAALARDFLPSIGRFVAPMEATWCLASPLVGARTDKIAVELVRRLEADSEKWDTLWLSGLSTSSRAFHTLARAFGARHRLGLGPTTLRHAASLRGGYDGWMGRRSAKFRANLRRAQRKAEAEGITFTYVDRFAGGEAVGATFERIMAIESRSWKGMDECGVDDGPMRDFYDRMTQSLGPRGQLRVVFAQHGDTDVAYVFGGILGSSYRGLQMSFVEPYRRFGLGNLVQAHMIGELAREGIETYDLGTDISYKTRWAEPGLTTVALVVQKR